MKHYCLLLPALLLVLHVSAQTQPVAPQTQKTLLTKKTATWCPLCGTWGWTFFQDLVTDNSSNAVFFAAHYSGDLQNPTALAMVANFGGSSQPRFYLNHTMQNVTSTNMPTARQDMRNQVTAAAAADPVAQTGLVAGYRGDTLRIRTRTRFFQPEDGEYFLGVYLVEKTVIANQASLGPNTQHKFVLRQSFSPTWYGMTLAQGQITAGTDIDRQFELIKTPMQTLSNLQIVSIIWKKEDDLYQIVNTNATDTFEQIVDVVSATDDLEARGYSWLVSPNPTRGPLTVATDFPYPLATAQLDLYDQLGRRVRTLYRGAWPAGAHQQPFEESELAAGVYFLRLNAAQGQLVRRLVIW